ncbi:MAG: hypothetical protein RIQ48_694 [Pseudomonadota bacterium]|jgi:hypothetical protein
MKIEEFVREGFYLNLDRKTKRNQQCIDQLQKYNLNKIIKRVSAIEAFPFEKKCDSLSEDWYKCVRANTESQLNIIKYAKEKKLENVLIFEDDFFFVEDGIINPIEQIEKAIDSIKFLNWDILYLGGSVMDSQIQMIDLNLIKVDCMLCAHAYILNYKMYNEVIKNYNHVCIMDNLLNYVCKYKYSVYPCMVVQKGDDLSDIGGHPTINPNEYIKSYLKPIKKYEKII